MSLQAFTVRDLPDPPRNLWRIVGPGIVAAGVGLSSGEFILWPFIASQAGLIFLWGAVLGVVTQFFLNMEIERYTLATGETALSGFNRFWKHWGLVFAVMVYFANLWPGWALSSATLASYIFGGEPRVIAIASLFVIGASLTLAPVVYVVLERLIFVKVAGVGDRRDPRDGVRDRCRDVARAAGRARGRRSGADRTGLRAAARRGGVCRRGRRAESLSEQLDSRQGFRHGAVRAAARELRSPASRKPIMARCWRFASSRHRRTWRGGTGGGGSRTSSSSLTFVLVTVATICLTSMLAYSTLYGREGLPQTVAFLEIEGQRLQELVGTWFGVLFWATGAFSLFASAMGITDYTSRLAADVLKTTYLRTSPISESRMYFWLVWILVGLGSSILLIGMTQPLVLLVISASVGGVMMCMYSAMLLVLNRRGLPDAIRVGGYRAAILIWSAAFFGVLSALTIKQQLERLLG